MTRGRPREFQLDTALDRAMEVFWRRGYEGASITELTERVGVSRPSLYAAFGTKEQLFRRVLAHYAEGPSAFVREALARHPARAAIAALLEGAVAALTDAARPPGCLCVQGALVCGPEADPIKSALTEARAATEEALRLRLEAGADAGELPDGMMPGDLARYLATVFQGMAVQAAGGASPADLQAVVELAMRIWPEERRASVESKP